VETIEQLAEFIRSDRITRTTLADQTGVLLDVEGLHVFSLNETGMFLVEAMCDGAADEGELVRRLVAEFEVDEATAKDDVATFLADLRKLLDAKKPK
jgi:hypothetical protein